MGPPISRADMEEVVRTMHANPDYRHCPVDELASVHPGSFIRYIVRSGNRSEKLYKVGAGYFKNAMFCPKKHSQMFWIHSKKRNGPFKIYKKSVVCVFVKDRPGVKLANDIAEFKRTIIEDRNATHNEMVYVMKAIKKVADKIN